MAAASRGHKGDIESEIQEGDAKVAQEVAAQKKDARLTPVSKPDQTKHDAAVAELQDLMKAEQEKINAINQEIRTKMATGGANPEIKAARDKMRELRSVKDRVMNERQALFDERDMLRAQSDKLMEAGKAMRGDLKFTDMSKIDDEIRKLEDKHSHYSMPIKEEKILVKQIEQLKSMRKQVERYSKHMETAGNARKGAGDSGKNLQTSIGEKNGLLRETNGQIAAQREILNKSDGENAKRREKVPEMRAEMDRLRASKDAKYQKIVTMRGEWKKNNDEFYTYRREFKKQQDEERKVEREVWEKENAEKRKEYEEELAKQKPWEEEIALCDFLASCLKRLDPDAVPESSGESKGEAADETKVAAGRKVEVDSEFKVYNKKQNDGDDFFMMAGAGKKKKGQKGKKSKKKKTGGVRLDVDTMASFEVVGLRAPVLYEEIPGVLSSVLEARAYYDTLPRDAVDKNKKKKGKKGKEEKKEKQQGSSSGDAITTPFGAGTVKSVQGDVIEATLSWGTAYGKF